MNNLSLTLVQSNLQWQQADANREILAELIAQSVEKTDLIILPEMFTSAFSMDNGAIAEDWPGATVDWMQEIARAHDSALCGSIAVNDKGQRLNRLVFVTPDSSVQFYDKRHLFRMLGEDKRYSSGSERIIIQWRGWRILPLVCYDLRFPVWSRNTADLDYDLLLYVANWPAARNQHWQTLLQARAIENMACVAGVNRIGRDGNDIDYIGHSMAIDASGKILLDAGETTGTYSVTLDKTELEKYRSAFPAHLDADDFEIK
ncbi:MAG: amidohydrolase [Gammaproteobacteria bacterium]|jgi:predicted amidohydrolase|nr:amidohydrolase [Gammaproteobacteria bacterium]MBT6043243.1 amidohydrolase [Gammaproteobacteria bacterium]